MGITYGKKDKVFRQYGKPSLLLDFARRKKLLDTVSKKNPITFTRASSVATYVDSDGLIKKAPVNLALYSEDFLSTWGTNLGSRLANQTIAPDGKQTADLLVDNSVSVSQDVSQGINVAAGVVIFSVWLKDENSGTARIRVRNGDSVITSKTVQTSPEWQRFYVVSEAATSSGGGAAWIHPRDNSSETGSVYAWGAQLEQADPATMAPTEYIKTTSTVCGAPRFDHEPTSGNVTTNLLTYSSNHTKDLTHNFLAGYTNTTHTLASSVTPPVEGDQVWIIQDASSNGSYAIKSTNTTATGLVSYTIFLKRYDVDSISLYSHFGSIVGTFNLANGTFTNGTNYNTQMTSYSNGWYKITWTRDYTNDNRITGINIQPGNVTVGGGVYVSGIQIENSSSPGPYVRTIGETRSISDARAESKGLLIEEARTNLRTYSFGNSTSIFKIVGNFTVEDSVEIAAPDGSSSTRKVTSPGGGQHSVDVLYPQGSILTSGSTYTVSCYYYATGETESSRTIGLRYPFSSYSGAIVLPKNQWVRKSLTFTHNGQTYQQLRVIDNDTGGFTQSSGSTIYLWGVQIEQGSFPTSYIPTEGSTAQRTADIATIEGNDFKRTNLLPYSEQFNQSPWVIARLRTVVADATIAPNGTTTADYIEQQAGQTNAGGIYVAKSLTTSDTISVYAKAAEKSFLRIQIVGGCFAYFDLENCSVGTTGGSGFVSASIENVGNGWCRLILTQSLVSIGLNVVFYLADTDNNSTVVDSGGVYLWGAQFERSDYPTDYIPTTSTSASAYSWANEEAGTMLCEYNKFAPNERQNRNAWTMDYDGSNYIGVFADYAYNDSIFVTVNRSAGGSAYYSGTSKPSVNTDIKISYAYTTLTSSVSTNAGTVGQINNSALPDMSRLTIGARHIDVTPLGGHIKKMTYWNSALSGSALQLMTGDE